MHARVADAKPGNLVNETAGLSSLYLLKYERNSKSTVSNKNILQLNKHRMHASREGWYIQNPRLNPC